jgi:hypothetical protein
MGMRQCGLNPGGLILLAEPTYPMIKDVLQPTLEKMLEEANWDFDYTASDLRYTVRWGEGEFGYADIILRSAENNRRWAGLNLSAGGLDEADLLKDNSAWFMLLSRLREGNSLQAFITTTPEGFGWVYETWKSDPKDGYELIQGRTMDNKSLPSEFIESLKMNYDEQLQKAYLNGEFCHIFGSQQTYYMWNRDYVKKNKYNSELPIVIGQDFNVSPSVSILWQQYNNDPKIRVIDEVVLRHAGEGELLTERMAREIKSRYPNNQYICIPDPAGRNRSTSSRRSDHQILRDEGFDVRAERRAIPVIERVNLTNRMLRSTIVDPKCKVLIKDFEQVINREGTRADIDKSNKELTHASDGFGYSVWSMFKSRIHKNNVRALPR